MIIITSIELKTGNISNGVGATETKVVSANGRAQWQVAGDAVGRESDDRVQRVHVGLFLSFAHLHRSENASRAGATPASAAPRTRLKRGVRRLQLSHYLAPAPVSFIGISICIYVYMYTHTHIYTHVYTGIHSSVYTRIHITYRFRSCSFVHSDPQLLSPSIRCTHSLCYRRRRIKATTTGTGRGFPPESLLHTEERDARGEKASGGKREKRETEREGRDRIGGEKKREG